MNFTLSDTIAAIATAPLPAGVAVIRLSGPAAWPAAAALCPRFEAAEPRTAHYGALVWQNETLDHALLLGFKAPASFTGEDVVEIHCHGGPATVQAVLQAVLAQSNVRQATGGEFTRRAVLNNKMDLTAAEGLADLIAAETEAQRQQALRQLDGALGRQFEDWRQGIMALVAQVEAGIDFPDEELEILADSRIQQALAGHIATLQAALATHAGERLRDGFRVVILGKPNAGKSTLTNLLTGKETAIVSPIAGTTRDVVETHLNINGFPIILADTAGLRESTDAIEQEGVKRATKQATQADVVLAVVDAAEWPNLSPNVTTHLQTNRSVLIVSKIDQQTTSLPATYEIDGEKYPVLGLNLQESSSLVPLLEELTTIIRKTFAHTQKNAQITRQRHRQAVTEALAALQQAQHIIANPLPEGSLAELVAQDLRHAAHAIGTVTGRTTNEDVLDLVFSTFCIGK